MNDERSNDEGGTTVLNDEEKSALSRRAFVGRLAAGAAGAAVTLATGVGQAKAMSPRGPSLLGPESGSSSEKHEVALAKEPQAIPELQGAQPNPVAEYPGETAPGTPPPWELFGPLAVGSSVGHGWQVAGLTGVVNGSCVLTLKNERGRALRIHLCRNDGSPQGLVYTERLDLVVMNGGVGDLPTEEGLAQAVAQVAHVLATNEGDRRHKDVMAALMPQAERINQFAAAATLR